VTAAHPGAAVTIWAEDEHRLGLVPVVRRVWAPRGQRPVARVRRRYEWLYVYAFVRPATGRSWWCLLPTVSLEAMGAALAAFAAEEGIGPDRRAVLVLDGAGWHAGATLAVPEGIDLVFLPPYSPELQPAERLWPLIDEPVANRALADLTALEDALIARCRSLRATPRTVKAHTLFHWWPRERRRRRT
jgi:transposase